MVLDRFNMPPVTLMPAGKPVWLAVLAENVLFFIFSMPLSLSMPLPEAPLLPENVLFVIFTVVLLPIL